jgi:hypothetical protein
MVAIAAAALLGVVLFGPLVTNRTENIIMFDRYIDAFLSSAWVTRASLAEQCANRWLFKLSGVARSNQVPSNGTDDEATVPPF